MSNRDEIVQELGFGAVPNIFERAAGNPTVETALWQMFRHIVLRGELPRTIKEMMGVLISIVGNSPYAAQLHLHALSVQKVETPLLDALRAGRIPEGVSSEIAALLRFAQEAAATPTDASTTQRLIEAGLSDAEVVEAVAVVALFRGVNAWTDLMSVPVDDI